MSRMGIMIIQNVNIAHNTSFSFYLSNTVTSGLLLFKLCFLFHLSGGYKYFFHLRVSYVRCLLVTDLYKFRFNWPGHCMA